jgi:hypothetical protein
LAIRWIDWLALLKFGGSMKDIRVGDIVNYHSIIGGKVTSSGHKVTAIEKRYGQWLAWITGKPACVSIKALSK